MEVIQIDGGNAIAPSNSVDSVGILYPGERMDIVTTSWNATTMSITLDTEYVWHNPSALTYL
jgi:hypothetical protein